MNIAIISMDHKDIALVELEPYKIDSISSDTVLFSKNIKNPQLAYTRKIGKVLFDFSEDNFKNYNWKKVYKKSFSLPQKYKKYAKYIWESVRNPKVDLKNAVTRIEIHNNKVVLITWENMEDFERRKAHKRPSPHPSSLHPKLARAMINLVQGKTVYDPFCGSGGTMLEGCLLGRKMIGYDIDPIMLKRAKLNLGKRKYTLKLQDATKVKKMNYFVADLPYGKNTKKSNTLYKDFFKDLKFKRAVVGFPSAYRFPKHIKVVHEFKYYLHKSLNKRIYVLEMWTSNFLY